MKDIALLWALLSMSVAFAQDKHSLVGAWKVDLTESDFVSGTAPKSMVATTQKDTPEMLSYRIHVVDGNGKAHSYSWSGPQDGSMHPFLADGKAAGLQGVRREKDGTLVRHGQDPNDGSSFDARDYLSADGNTLTDEETAVSKDGKAARQKVVWHRIHSRSR